jgi:hypothetical protein
LPGELEGEPEDLGGQCDVAGGEGIGDPTHYLIYSVAQPAELRAKPRERIRTGSRHDQQSAAERDSGGDDQPDRREQRRQRRSDGPECRADPGHGRRQPAEDRPDARDQRARRDQPDAHGRHRRGDLQHRDDQGLVLREPVGDNDHDAGRPLRQVDERRGQRGADRERGLLKRPPQDVERVGQQCGVLGRLR